MRINALTRKLAAAVMVLTVLTSTGIELASACSCFPTPPPLEAAASTKFVFTGRVTTIRHDQAQGEFYVQITVGDVYKGDLGAEALVVTADSGATCGYFFQVDTEYLIYGGGTEDLIHVNHCSRTRTLGSAQADILALKASTAPLPLTDQLFFTSASESVIHRVSTDGTALTELINLEETFGAAAFAAHGLAVSRSGLVWAGRDGIYLAGVDGSFAGKMVNAGPVGAPTGVTTGDAGVYWTQFGQPEIFAANPAFRFPLQVGGRPLGIASAGVEIYWTDNQQFGIYTLSPRDGRSEPIQLIDLRRVFGQTSYHPVGIAASTANLFWVDSEQDTIYTSPLDGRGASELIDLDSRFGEADYDPIGIAASDSQIFWTDAGTETAAIYTANLDGTNARKLLDPPSNGSPRWIAFLPGQPKSNLRLRSIRRSTPTMVTLEWDAVSDQNYRIEKSGNLQRWEELTTVRGAAGDLTSYTDEKASESASYYRVVQLDRAP